MRAIINADNEIGPPNLVHLLLRHNWRQDCRPLGRPKLAVASPSSGRLGRTLGRSGAQADTQAHLERRQPQRAHT